MLLVKHFTEGYFFTAATYTVEYTDPGNYIISGAFDTLKVKGEGQTISAVCLRQCAEGRTLCMNFSDYDISYLHDVEADQLTYPIGDTIVEYGYFHFIKADTLTTYSGIFPGAICFDNQLILNVASFPYDCKELSFYLFPPTGLIIDGDTVYSMSDPPLSYSGSDFEMSYNGSADYVITGNFEQIHPFGSDFCWKDICISECHYPPDLCLNFGLYDSVYLIQLNSDHIAYPPGGKIMEAGDLEVVKMDTTTIFGATTPDSLCISGTISIAVGTVTYPCRSVRIDLTGADGVTVDGENVFDMIAPPASYAGSGFTFSYDGGSEFVIEGTYDSIRVYGSGFCVYDICLEECGFKSSQCLSLSAYDDAYLADVSSDHTTYPPGDPFITDGNIQLVKPNTSSTYNLISGDSISFSGDIIIDVSLAPFVQRKLDFSLAAPTTITIDAETVSPTLLTPGSYSGADWEIEMGGACNYVVTGDFDQVLIEGAVNYLDNVCLYEYSTAELQSEKFGGLSLYPNPTKGTVQIENSGKVMQMAIYSVDGKLKFSSVIYSGKSALDVSFLDTGIYFFHFVDIDGRTRVSRVVKN